jgi:hypothetical protein
MEGNLAVSFRTWGGHSCVAKHFGARVHRAAPAIYGWQRLTVFTFDNRFIPGFFKKVI